MLKTDSKGNIQWIQSYPSKEYVADLVKTPLGGYVISGAYVNGTGCWMAKVDSTGAVQWSRDYNGVFIYRIVQANDGGYAMVCEVFASDGLRVAALIKTDSEGNMIWNQTYGSSIQFIRFLQTTDTGYALAGNTFRTNTSKGAVLLTKTDSLGNVVWNQTYSQLGEEAAMSIAQTRDGGYALGCGNNFNGNLAKVDSAGNLQWNISFSSNDFSLSNVGSVMQLSDGGYVFVVGNALTKTVTETSLPSMTPTNTIPEFHASVTILAVILITTTVASISLKYTRKHFQ